MFYISKRIRRLLLAAGLMAVLVYFLLPVYGFFSHKEKLPHLPFGWLDLPTKHPKVQVLDDARYLLSGDAALTALVRHRESIGAPALSAAVAIDGVRVWAGAVGWQDIKDQKPITVNTQFRIGSTSKAVTATTLARMLQADLIDLDQPLADLYKALPNPQWAKITPRQLASHTAGLAHYGQTKDISGMYRFMALNKHFDNVEDAVSLFDDTPLLFATGEGFSYSSLGTVLLSSYMQRVGEKPFQELVSELVLEPLKMHDTEVVELSPGLATHYWKSSKADFQRIREWRYVDLSHRLAGGGFISTPSDLTKLGSAYFDESFLNAATVEKIWQPQALNNGEINEQNYALGWRKGTFISDERVHSMYHHGGVSRGAQSWLAVFPDSKMTIALNTNINTKNFSDFASIYRDIANEFLETARQHQP